MKRLIKQTLSACAALALLSGASYAADPLLSGTSGAVVVADKDLANVKGSGQYSMQYSYYGAYYASYALQYAALGNYYNYLGTNTYAGTNYFEAYSLSWGCSANVLLCLLLSFNGPVIFGAALETHQSASSS
jgi:hypothetical protein